MSVCRSAVRSLVPFSCLAFGCLVAAAGLHARETGGSPSFKDHPQPPDVKLAEPPALEDPQGFSMIVLGDPQSYVKFGINQPIFELQTAWAAAQKERLKVKTVICTGDLVEHNDLLTANGGTLYPGRNNGNQTSVKQWAAVSRAFERLDGVYPYVVTTGNHDFGHENAENRNSRFPEFFHLERNPLWERTIVSTAPNAFGRHSLENAAYEYADPVWGGLLVVVLEFKPRDEALEWAAKLVSSERYAGHKVILLTHSFLDTDGTVTTSSKYKMSPGNEAAQVLEKLVRPSKNIRLVICGHTGDTETMSAFRSEPNAEGKAVHMMMFNPQAISGWNGNGGDGWLRLLEFQSDGKTIRARTWSPLFGASQKTEASAWSRNAKDEFRFVMD